MKKIIFKGNCTAIITPFDSKGKVNFGEFEKLIEFQVQNGVSAIVFLGTTGESATLSHREKIEIIKFAVKTISGRVPVIVGAGSNDTLSTISFCTEVEKLGGDALLLVTPYYNKCTQNGLIEHYTAISKSVNLPIILYNVPSRTGVNMQPHTVYELSKLKNIVGIKEASGNIEQAMEINRLCGDNIAIYSGDDALTFPMLSVGAVGGISVVGNIEPKLVSLMYNHYFAGNHKKAREIHYLLLPLIKSLFCEVNPIPIKYALSQYGFAVGSPRLPLTKLGYENQKLLKDIIKEFNG